MNISDISRLRGKAPKSTHLARYERANDQNAKNVLDIPCPDCGVDVLKNCTSMEN